MKTVSQITAFAMAILMAFANFNVNAQTTDTLQMPFVEHFTEGSLQINNWTTDCDNWAINTFTGQPAPCVRFNGQPFITGPYSRSLTSDWISLKDKKEYSKVGIRFQYKGLGRDISSDEILFVEVFDSMEWHTVYEINTFNSNWNTKVVNLTSYLSYGYFKVRFRVTGNNSADIYYWELDNIFVYNLTRSSTELKGNYNWLEDEFGIKVEWHDEMPIGEWGMYPLSWSWDLFTFPNFASLYSSEPWFMAAKWDSLQYYSSRHLVRTVVYLQDVEYTDSVFFNIWRGENGDILQHRQNITDVIEDEWSLFYVSPSVVLTDTSPTWMGLEIYGGVGVGTDNSSAITSYGDLYKNNIDTNWTALSNNGIDANWLIGFYFKDSPYFTFNGYNVYRKENADSNYLFYQHLECDYDYDVAFFDKYPNVDIQNSYWYQIKNEYINPWVIPKDTIESLPAYVTGTDDDFVTILVTRLNEISYTDSPLLVYPNPATTKLNIKSKLPINNISIFDLSGKLLWERNIADKHKVEIDVSSFKSGIYLINIDNGVRVNSNKIVIQ